jgi:hypothetical protein
MKANPLRKQEIEKRARVPRRDVSVPLSNGEGRTSTRRRRRTGPLSLSCFLRGFVVACLVVPLLLAGCGNGEHREAREKFNEGVAALAKNDFDAAEKALVDARGRAGVDPELRFRAAYDLGLAYAGHADAARAGENPDLARALDLAQHAASWFGDAARLRKDDADTKANLAIVRARVQAISDELRKGEGKLEARLDALIAEQRDVLEDARAAWLAVKRAGGADPLAQQGTLTHLADRERGVVAEAGVIGDLADDETGVLEKKPDDQRSAEDKSRVVQLKNLGLYLNEARARIGEARRKLQDLAAQDGVARAEAALAALKRAREQLLDPITALRGVAQDQLVVLGETERAAGDASIGNTKKDDEPLPAWLEPPMIAPREAGLRDRVEEVRARLAAFVEHKETPTPDKPADPKRAKLVERVSAALPAITEASAAMNRARESLAANRAKPALGDEQAALDALARAIEEFVDLKNLIDIAYVQQKEIGALLAPESAKELEPAVRAKRTKEGVARNVARAARLRGLIAEELAGVEEKAKPPEPAQPGADPEKEKRDAEETKKRVEAEKERLAQAEKLRADAATALDALDKAIAAAGDPQPPAKEAEAKLDELRKLFFSVIEHLQQLIRDQGETKDQTSAANADDVAARAPKLPGLAGREEDHGRMAKAITEALAKQADAAAGKPPQQGAPDGKALAGAVQEMRLAGTSIDGARDAITKTADPKATDPDLAPAVKEEGDAIEHLEAALRLLQPPKDKKQDKNEDQQQQQQQNEPKPQQGAEKPQTAGGAAQQARDDDARRQRERRAKGGRTEPVEKDW